MATVRIEEFGTVRLWDVATGRELRSICPPKGLFCRMVSFSPDGKALFLDGDKMWLWDLTSDKAISHFPIPLCVRTGQARPFLSPDGKTLAISYGIVRLWDVASGRQLHPDRGHEEYIDQLSFFPDGKTLFTAARDDTVRFWDMTTGRETHRIPWFWSGHDSRLASSADGRTLAGIKRIYAAEGAYSTICLWDTVTGKEIRRIDVLKGVIGSLALSPDGKTLAGLNGPDFDFNRPDFDPDNKPQRVWDIHIWDVATGKKRLTIAGPDPKERNSGAQHAFSPDGRLLASTFDGRTVRFWHSTTGQEVGRVELPDSASASFTFSPDGQTLAVVDYREKGNPHVHLFETASGQRIREIEVDISARGIVFSPDGRMMAYSDDSRGDVRLWCMATGRELLRLPGHGGGSCVAFSPDGRRLATGGADTTALIWDLAAFSIKPGLPTKELSAQELEKRWADLGADDAAVAHQAAWALSATPKQAVALLKDRLRPTPGSSEERINKLIADLDDNSFAVREAAAAELKKLATVAEFALHQALGRGPSLEVRRRVEHLLADWKPRPGLGLTGEPLRTSRAIQVLERIGTKEAREVLERLAKDTSTREAQEAQAALERLAKR